MFPCMGVSIFVNSTNCTITTITLKLHISNWASRVGCLDIDDHQYLHLTPRHVEVKLAMCHTQPVACHRAPRDQPFRIFESLNA